jgi:hypothetical protein
VSETQATTIMKVFSIVALLITSLFFGCSTESMPVKRPFVFIANAKKIGSGPRETSSYQVTIHYKNLEPDKYEIKVGYGYISSDPKLKPLLGDSNGLFGVAHSEVLHQASGEMDVTIASFDSLKLKGTLNGKIHATLAKYPHGKEWVVASYDVFNLTPD